MVQVTFTRGFLAIKAIFRKMRMPNPFCLLSNKKVIVKVNFSQKYKVFLPKKIQNELGTNKQPSLVTCLMCHPKWEQNSSHHFCHYRCQKSERNPKGEVEWKHNYLNKNICYIRKIHLVKKLFKPTTLYLLWKPTKMSTFMPFTSSSGSDRSSPS